MEEYRIVVQNGSGKPYSVWTFDNFDSCYYKLLDMIRSQCTWSNKEYYVFNDFYNNEYPPFVNARKYTIEHRKVSDWKIYKEKKQKNKNSNSNGKIVNLF